MNPEDIVIVGACRTPVGAFSASLSTLCIGGGQGVALTLER